VRERRIVKILLMQKVLSGRGCDVQSGSDDSKDRHRITTYSQKKNTAKEYIARHSTGRITPHNTTSHTHEEERTDGEKRVEKATKGEEEWKKREGDNREEKEKDVRGKNTGRGRHHIVTLTLISKSSSHTSSNIVK
jgi:hypothetical protein